MFRMGFEFRRQSSETKGLLVLALASVSVINMCWERMRRRIDGQRTSHLRVYSLRLLFSSDSTYHQPGLVSSKQDIQVGFRTRSIYCCQREVPLMERYIQVGPTCGAA